MFDGLREIFGTFRQIPTLIKAKILSLPLMRRKFGTLGGFVERNAEKFPDHEVIVFEGKSITWLVFNRLCNRYAHAFSDLGVKQGDTVAVMMDNRIEMLAVITALGKVGAIASLINTTFRRQSIVHDLEITDCTKFIFGEEHLSAIEEILTVLSLQQEKDYFYIQDRGEREAPIWAVDLEKMSHNKSTQNFKPEKPVSPYDRAVYIFTSGTTGMPKAVVWSHWRFNMGGWVFHLLGYRGDETDRLYLCLPLYHSSGLVAGWASTLWSGGTSVLRRKFSSSHFLEDVRKYNCTQFLYIGELCRYLLDTPESPNDKDNPLKCIVGNGLRPDIWRKFKERFGIDRVAEFYGATEGVIFMINFFNKENTTGFTGARHLLVKYDVYNDEIMRDKRGRCIRCKRGEPGLMIGTFSRGFIFEGYTRPSDTNKKLIHNVLKEGDTWYNTGDILKRVNVGFAFGFPHYQFVDRIGDTFRWHGENVSTSEVSEGINQHPQVALSSVYGVKIPGACGKAGMAAIVLSKGVKELDLDHFSKFINEILPPHSRPKYIRIKNEMPLTGTFKLVKGELVAEGYDLAKVKDPMYMLSPTTGSYAALKSHSNQ